jgi:hypothetical protein
MERSRYPQRFRFLLQLLFTVLLLSPLKFYQEDIVQRNNSRSYGIVLVRNRVSSPFNPLILGLSLRSHRDAGMTQMTRHRHKTSMTH